MKAMRVMGGHQPLRGTYFVARNDIRPSNYLIDEIFPFVPNALKEIRVDQVTAKSTLMWFQMLAKIILQDVACMMIAGRTHCLFKHPIFRTLQFKAFLEEMKNKMSSLVTERNSTVESVLPGVLQTQNGLKTGQNELKKGQHKIVEEIKKATSSLLTTNHMSQFIDHVSQFEMSQDSQESDGLLFGTSEMVGVQKPTETQKYNVNNTHSNLRSIMEEYNGVGLYEKGNTGLPQHGGIKYMEQKFKATWRRTLNGGETKAVLRIKIIG